MALSHEVIKVLNPLVTNTAQKIVVNIYTRIYKGGKFHTDQPILYGKKVTNSNKTNIEKQQLKIYLKLIKFEIFAMITKPITLIIENIDPSRLLFLNF